MQEDRYPFASRRGKATLFKFRPYSTWSQRRWVKQIIQKHKVYFSRASQLNDPFDMSPRLEPVTRQALIAGAQSYWSQRSDVSEAERQRRINYFAECDLDERASAAQSAMTRYLEGGYGVFSLAGNRNHPMLWSHYAQGHTGLCIHFHATKDAIFGGAMEVIYSDRRPLIPVEIFTISQTELFHRITLHKGSFWKYEEEFRFLKIPDVDMTGLPIRIIGRYGHIGSHELAGITIGARMPERRAKEVIALARNHTPSLPVWRAVETDSFEFDFESVS